ncbi:hypothetical protein AB205_0120540 [Aquarana catesbeiana]|uniref:Uncharacterized protein n=1 Tax=Aquarana catesbeiana TaxID=8400 RepID=A0A2G9R917_AQUCT|nr:hypothetical protein AB205_0120540 [Aquarana catesbeiana]
MPLPTISQYEPPQRSYCQYSYSWPHAFGPNYIYHPIHRPLCIHTAQCTMPRGLLMQVPLLLIPHREHIL